ncbi:MAG: hypothetical protein WD378_01230 [Egicoccus sp.]
MHGSPDGVVERFVPGLDLPVEPAPPRRGRAAMTIALVVILAVLAVYLAVEVVSGSQAEDPSLSDSAGQGQQ